MCGKCTRTKPYTVFSYVVLSFFLQLDYWPRFVLFQSIVLVRTADGRSFVFFLFLSFHRIINLCSASLCAQTNMTWNSGSGKYIEKFTLQNCCKGRLYNYYIFSNRSNKRLLSFHQRNHNKNNKAAQSMIPMNFQINYSLALYYYWMWMT